MSQLTQLHEMKCEKCRRSMRGFSESEVAEYLANLPNWEHVGDTIRGIFDGTNFNRALGFLKQIAQIANTEDHHPILLSIENCRDVVIIFNTTVINDLTKNDFIMAAKVDQLYKEMQ